MKSIKLMSLLLFLLPISAFGQEYGFKGEFGMAESKYGSFEMKDSSGHAFGADVTKDFNSFRIKLGSEGETHRFAAGIFTKNLGFKDVNAIRLKYSLLLPLIRTSAGGRALYSETSLVGGYLDVNGKKFPFRQILYGYRQQLGSEIVVGRNQMGVKTGWQWSGARQEDSFGIMNQWDNYGMSVGGFLTSQLHDRLRMSIEVDGARKRYNRELYFFVERWTEEYEFRSQLVIGAHPNLDVIPLLNYRKVNIERDGRADLAQAEYGMTTVFKFSKGVEVFGQGIYAPWRHKEGEETILSVGARNANFSAEIFRREKKDVYSTFTIGEKIVGLQFSMKFGDSLENKLKSVKDYGYVAEEKHKFYLREGYDDDRSLDLYQQAERLRTLRTQNEWTDNWKYVSQTYWDPLRAYKERRADCDGQQCPNNVMHTRNGYKAYLPAWWDFGKSFTMHATGLIQDPYTGEWFWQEYGMLAKVADVGPNDSPEQVTAQAIRQNHWFSALPINSNSSTVYYSVIDCSEPDLYVWPSSINLTSIPGKPQRPRVEYGTELFTGRDFLFDYR